MQPPQPPNQSKPMVGFLLLHLRDPKIACPSSPDIRKLAEDLEGTLNSYVALSQEKAWAYRQDWDRGVSGVFRAGGVRGAGCGRLRDRGSQSEGFSESWNLKVHLERVCGIFVGVPNDSVTLCWGFSTESHAAPHLAFQGPNAQNKHKGGGLPGRSANIKTNIQLSTSSSSLPLPSTKSQEAHSALSGEPTTQRDESYLGLLSCLISDTWDWG